MRFQNDGWSDDGLRPGRPVPQEFDGDDEAVDLFDAAARIEARGYSDRTVHSKYGYDSVFDLARDILGGRARLRMPER